MTNPKVQIRIENPENILNTKEDGRKFWEKQDYEIKGLKLTVFKGEKRKLEHKQLTVI